MAQKRHLDIAVLKFVLAEIVVKRPLAAKFKNHKQYVVFSDSQKMIEVIEINPIASIWCGDGRTSQLNIARWYDEADKNYAENNHAGQRRGYVQVRAGWRSEPVNK